MRSRAGLLLLLAVAVFLIFWRLGGSSLHDGDEAHYAQVAKEAYREGHWLTLHFAGSPWFEKPPLIIWIQAALFRLAGVSETTVRLPAALFGLAAVLATFGLGRRLGGETTGLVAASFLLLAPSFLFEHSARSGEFDSAVVFLTVLIYALIHRFARDGKSLLPAFAATGALFMIKNVLALFPLGTGLLALFAARDGRRPGVRELLGGAGVFLLIALPWHVQQLLANGSTFLDAYVGEQILARATETFVPGRGISFYPRMLFNAAYPWVFLAAIAWGASVVAAFRTRRLEPLMLSVWPAGYLAVIAAASSRFPHYVLPILPPLAILAGRFMTGGPDRDRALRAGVLVTGVLLVIARTRTENYNPFLEKSINASPFRAVLIDPRAPANGIDAVAGGAGLALVAFVVVAALVRVRWLERLRRPAATRAALVALVFPLLFAHAIVPLRHANTAGPTKKILAEFKRSGEIQFSDRRLYFGSWYIVYFYADQLLGLRENPALEREFLERRRMFKQIHGGRRNERGADDDASAPSPRESPSPNGRTP